jgi:hypothetical protein
MDTQRELFFKNSKLLAFGRQNVPNISGVFGGIFGWLISTHFGTVSHLFMFLHKTKPLYPNPKNIFGIGIWIWAAKNKGFSHLVSVVRHQSYAFWFFAEKKRKLRQPQHRKNKRIGNSH